MSSTVSSSSTERGRATASGTTLDAKGGTLGGLTDVGEGDTAELAAKCLCKTNGCGALALAERGGCDTGNEDVTTVASVFKTLEHVERNLGLGRAVRLKLMLCNADLGGDLVDQLRVLSTRNLNVRGHRLLKLEGERSDVT